MREVVGELLDVPGAARRVGDPGQLRLFQQHGVRIAGDPGGKRVRAADRGVEGQHGDRVRPADAGREAGNGGAEHVHPRVALREHRGRSDGVLAHALRRGAGHLGHPRPEPPGGAELRDREELVGGRGEPELELCGRGFDIEPGLGQRPKIGDPGRDGRAQLLRVRPARLVERQPVGDDRPDFRVLRGDTRGQRRGGRQVRRTAGAGGQPDRVRAERGDRRAGWDLPLGEYLEQRLRRRFEPLARVKHDRREVDVDLVQDVGRRKPAQDEPDRGDAALEVGQDRAVDGPGVVTGESGADVPAGADLALRPRAADVRRQPREPDLGGHVLGRVERLDGDAVIRPGDELALRNALEVLGQLAALAQHACHQVLPLFPRRSGKFGGQGQGGNRR